MKFDVQVVKVRYERIKILIILLLAFIGYVIGNKLMLELFTKIRPLIKNSHQLINVLYIIIDYKGFVVFLITIAFCSLGLILLFIIDYILKIMENNSSLKGNVTIK